LAWKTNCCGWKGHFSKVGDYFSSHLSHHVSRYTSYHLAEHKQIGESFSLGGGGQGFWGAMQGELANCV
jgi:hypothetical protein